MSTADAPPPYSDHGPAPKEPAPLFHVDDWAMLRSGGYPVPAGTAGRLVLEVDRGSLWLVDFGPGAQHLVREAHMSVVEKAAAHETPEEQFARQCDEFLRDLTSGGPVSAGPLPCTRASCCGVGSPAEPDDGVTDDLRDLVVSQSLAMATSRTRQGVAIGAMAILMAARGDEIGAVLARGIKGALGGLGDLLHGVDLDGMVKQAMAGTMPAVTPETFTVGVQVDGKTVGTVTVPVGAGEAQVVDAIRNDAVLMAKIPSDRQVTGVEYTLGKVVRITTAPVEAGTVMGTPAE